MQHVYAVIMAGGRGERFWPLSTAGHPKQFLDLIGGRPLIQMAVDRLAGLLPPERVMVVTSADLVAATRAAVPQLPVSNIVGEPVARDTAAACALASAWVAAHDPQGCVIILTADQIMEDLDVYRSTLRESAAIAQAGSVMVTIGIRPAFASTGFGYIEAGARWPHGGQIEFFKALRFVEKPDRATAEGYVDCGRFYWNAGMFVWAVSTLRAALGRFRPPLAGMFDRLLPAIRSGAFEAQLAAEYADLEKISIDYAVMEKADNIVMAKGVFRWDDVGTWPALMNHLPADPAGNVVLGACEALESSGNVVVSRGRLTALLGVKDLVVVHAENATLICPRDRAQDIKKIVQALGARGIYQDLL